MDRDLSPGGDGRGGMAHDEAWEECTTTQACRNGGAVWEAAGPCFETFRESCVSAKAFLRTPDLSLDDLRTFVTSLRNSTDCFVRLAALSTSLETLFRATEERNVELARDLIVPAWTLLKQTERGTLTDEEEVFLTMCKTAYSDAPDTTVSWISRIPDGLLVLKPAGNLPPQSLYVPPSDEIVWVRQGSEAANSSEHKEYLAPDQCRELLANLSITVRMSEPVFQSIAQLVLQLGSLLTKKEGSAELHDIRAAVIEDDGYLFPARFQVDQSALFADPSALAEVVHCFTDLREALMNGFESFKDKLSVIEMRNFMKNSGASFREIECIPTLLSACGKEWNDSLGRLLMQPSVDSNVDNHRLFYPIEKDLSPERIEYVMSHVVSGDDAQYQQLKKTLERIDYFKKFALPALEQMYLPLSQHKVKESVANITARIKALAGQDSSSDELAAGILAIQAMAAHPELGPKLKNRIVNLADLQTAADKSTGRSRDELSGRVREIRKNLSYNLNDFRGNQEVVDLVRDMVSKILKVYADPKLLGNCTCDEVLDNGILLHGYFGVGKTFLVLCTANEFGLPVLDITLQDFKEDGYASVRKKIEDLAAQGPFIVFFNEVEQVAHCRKDPTITSDQKAATCATLQLVEEIRRTYPNLVLFYATNYLQDIDGGIRDRELRSDAVYELLRPGIDACKEHLVGNLAEQEHPPLLSEAELTCLAVACDGLMPGSIKKAVFQPFIFGREPAHVTYSDLMESIMAKRKNRGLPAVELEADGFWSYSI